MYIRGIHESLLWYNPVFNVLAGYDLVFNVLELYAQKTNTQKQNIFIQILSLAKVLICRICYCYFWWLFNNSNYWFLYRKLISIFYEMINGQLNWRFILPIDEFIKSFIVYLRGFTLPHPLAGKFLLST